MDQVPMIDPRGERRSIEISKSDLLAAWSILENLAVSLDQIGGFLGAPIDGPFDEERRLALLGALRGYLTPDLIGEINHARIRLGDYIEDGEAELISENINYWSRAIQNG